MFPKDKLPLLKVHSNLDNRDNLNVLNFEIPSHLWDGIFILKGWCEKNDFKYSEYSKID